MPPKIQHLRSTTANKRPDPALLADGQMAQNTAAVSPGAFIKLADGKVAKIGPTHVGTTAPNATPAAGGSAGNSVGEGWLDTSLNPPALKVWNGTAWVAATPLRISTDADNTTILGSDGGIYTPPFEETELGELVVLVTQDLNLYVATTGSDETGDGTQALPWATPHRAMTFLSKCVLSNDIVATVFVADGNYTFTQSLNVSHPQGSQITITGTSTSGARPVGTDLNGGGAKGNTAAAESFNDAKLKAYYNTQWQFNGCSGVICQIAGGATIDKVLIRGDRVTDGCFGVGTANAFRGTASVGAITLGTEVAIHNFNSHGILASNNGTVIANFVTATSCGGVGFFVNNGGGLGADDATASNNGGTGIRTNYGGTIVARRFFGIYNALDGAGINQGGCVSMAGSTLRWNSRHGFYGVGGIAYATNCQASNNDDCGVIASAGSVLDFSGSTIDRNLNIGVYVVRGTSITIANGTVTGTSARQTQAFRSIGTGYIYMKGATFGGTVSPAVNTIGNGNCLISNNN